MLRSVIVIVLVVAGTAVATPRRALLPANMAQAVVRGIVLSTDRGEPLRAARVAIVGSAAGTDPVVTDQEGRFAVVAPAAYTLRITKAGFAPALVTGRAAPDAAPLEVPLERGAVLTGFVADELGFPVTEARVRARRLEPPPDAVAAGLVEFTADTDEAGAYRIGSLPAARYSVHTERPLAFGDTMGHVVYSDVQLRMEQELRRQLAARIAVQSDVMTVETRAGEETVLSLVHKLRAVLPPDAPIGGAIGGFVLDELGDPAEALDVRLWSLRYSNDRLTAMATRFRRWTDDRGYYRFFHVPPGRYLLEAASDDACCAPVYYPGVTAIARAAPITIGRKQEIAGVDLVFTRTRDARVFGFALGAAGGALQGAVTLTSSRRSGAIALPPKVATPDPSGVFEFLNVPPGEYVLRAMGAGREIAEFGMQFVTVEGPEMAPITIAASRAATVAGEIVLEGNAQGVSPRSLGLTIVPDSDEGPAGAVPAAVANDDRTFEMRGLAGLLRFGSGNLPDGWWLKSVEIDGVNAAETPVRFAGPPDSRTGVRVVFSAAGAMVTGRVTDERGEPAGDYWVLVYAVDRNRWFGRSPYVRVARGPEIDGGFAVRPLPPGDYFVVAVDGIDGDAASGDWQNPDVLDTLASSARRVSVGEGQQVAIDLRLVRLVR